MTMCWKAAQSRRMKKRIIIIMLIPVCLYAVLWIAALDTHIVKRLTQTIDEVQQRVSGFEAKRTNQNRGNESKKVLLVAYFRTGSTFTAELLNHLSGSFYMFEPLYTYYSVYKKRSQVPLLLNGTMWWRLFDGYQVSYASHIIQSVLNCDFLSVDKFTLLAYARHSKMLSRFRLCIQDGMTLDDIREICVRQLREECLEAPIRVLKTIRTPMELVGGILKVDPNVKVIHLLRDPRGHLRSWLAHGTDRANNTQTIQRVCSRITNDIKYRKKLEQEFPESFMEIIYESLSQFPGVTLQRLYNWLNLSVNPGTIRWLKNQTQSIRDGNFMETFRKNSTLTAYSWTKVSKFALVKVVNRYCGYVINHGNFPAIETVADLKDFQVPSRERPI